MLSELWSDARYRLRALIRRRDMERELDAELRYHLEREAEKLQALGVARDEAMRRARLAFGGVERAKEASRDTRGTVLLESLAQDLRYAVRVLRATPAFALGVMLTLGLGIGANAAMFGIADRLLFRPPAYLPDADRVHRVYFGWTDRGERFRQWTSFARYRDMVRWTRSFSSIATFATWRIAVGDGEAARETPVGGVSASYFDFFNARPAVGRFFTTLEDAAPTGSPVVVLSHAYWQVAFGGRRDVLGTSLRIGRTLCTVIGVAPEGFVGIQDEIPPAMYIPIATFLWDARPIDYTANYAWQGRVLIAKRKPGVSVAAATADMTAAFQRSWLANMVADTHLPPIESARPRVMLGPVQFERGPVAGPETKVVAWVSGVAIIVLLIACANVANLLLARAVTRRREIALRLALGVSRQRLIRQLASESVVLAVLGGGLGLAVAQWGGAVIRALFLPNDANTMVFTDWRTLVITFGATLVAALLTGLAPAAYALRYDLARSLGAAGHDAGVRQSPARTALLVLQATLSVVLLVGAGLFVRSLLNVRGLHLGYDVDPVLVVTDQTRGVTMTPVGRATLERRLADEARSVPGVISATPVSSVPFWGFDEPYLYVPGIDTVYTLGDDFVLQAGGPDYFRTTGTRVLRGRAFTDRDGATAPRVTVVSQGMARVLWPSQDPIGKCIRIRADTAPCTTVVGVAEDLHMRSLTAKREHTYYVPWAQYGQGSGTLFARVAGDAADYAEPVRRQLQRVMPGAAYVTAVPFRTIVDPTMRSWRLGATMFVAFGVVALVLAGVGLGSTIAYHVAQRRREIGVRIALGASRTSVVRLVVRGGLRVVTAGVVIGGIVSLEAGQWMAALLFNESPTDPVIYCGVAAVLVGVALVATALPALTASRVDPSVALRAE